MTTTQTPAAIKPRAPRVAFAITATVDTLLYVASISTVASGNPIRELPTLITLGLALMVAVPTFAAMLTMIWRSA